MQKLWAPRATIFIEKKIEKNFGVVLDPFELPLKRIFWYLEKIGVLKFFERVYHPEPVIHALPYKVKILKSHFLKTKRASWNVNLLVILTFGHHKNFRLKSYGLYLVWVSVTDQDNCNTVEPGFNKLFERWKNVYYCQVFIIYPAIYARTANFGKQQKV